MKKHYLFALVSIAFVSSACIRGKNKTQQGTTQAGRPAPDVDQLLAKMTLDEKIGQMTQVDTKALKPKSDMRTYFIGSVLNGGDSLPEPNTPKSWADTYDGLQELALSTRLAIPMIYGVDAVHGHNGVKGAVIFPHNIGLGATRDSGLVQKVARATAVEVAGTGIDWTFAPCVAVPRNERWGRTYEGFGETPELASEMGVAAVRGYQTAQLSDETAVLACAKHFLGDGGTTNGKDQGNTEITEEELRRIHLPAYKAAIDAGVGSIMISYSQWNGLHMHANRQMITDVLKGEMGFKGFVVTDWEAIDKMPHPYEKGIELAINAGIDMVMVPHQYKVFIGHMKNLVASGRIPQSRIDDAVRRILVQKKALGLWERPFTNRALTERIGSKEHRELAREAVRKSLVLLKNEGKALPLAKNGKRIHVAGAHADDVGAQSGGWTVSWQGKRGPITPGTSILAAIRDTAPDAEVSYSVDGSGAENADAIVAVIGETPYAEFEGDRATVDLAKEDLALVERLADTGKPVVVILISGRPMVLGPALDRAQAFVAAWLPGTEGQGVADVLFGDHAPTGKLPHSWPRSMDQVPINVGDANYDPQFPFGFGLSYD